MANPTLTSVTPESGGPSYTLAPGAYSPWFVAVGQDADAKTASMGVTIYDEAGHPSNQLMVGPFTWTDALHVDPAGITFPAGTPYAVEVDPANPLRFRIRNTNV